MKYNSSQADFQVSPEKCKVIVCAAVFDEIISLIPEGMKYEALDFGLHVNPQQLKKALQQSIDTSEATIEYIILGYGLCSMAVVGLHSENHTLIIPRIDDCIALFLGSTETYRQQHARNPGTYYLTKGWIDAGETPLDEYDRLLETYGEEKADEITGLILKNYNRLGLINTGHYSMDDCRQYSRRFADKFNLTLEEISGSDLYLKALLNGPWDDRFLVVKPGEKITFFNFR